MAYSNRPSHRPDPTIAPVVVDAQGKLRMRDAFTPSAYLEKKNNERVAARKRNRKVPR